MQIDFANINVKNINQNLNGTSESDENNSVDFNIEQSTITSKGQIKFVNEDNVDLIHSFKKEEDEFLNEDPLDLYRTPANETLLISEIPKVIDDENIIVVPGEGKTPYSLINDEFCEELAHPHLFPTGKFGYKVMRDVKLNPSQYFNQRLLNYSQKFSSDADYIFFAHQVLQQID